MQYCEIIIQEAQTVTVPVCGKLCYFTVTDKNVSTMFLNVLLLHYGEGRKGRGEAGAAHEVKYYGGDQ